MILARTIHEIPACFDGRHPGAGYGKQQKIGVHIEDSGDFDVLLVNWSSGAIKIATLVVATPLSDGRYLITAADVLSTP